MNRLAVAPVVEGHAEVEAVPILLRRLWYEALDGEYINVLRPIRVSRGRLGKREEVGRAVLLAASRLAQQSEPSCVLLLLDSDGDCAAEMGPRLREWALAGSPSIEVVVVVAVVEFETWFVGAAPSLSRWIDLENSQIPENPEQTRQGKRWIQDRFRGRYSEVPDQPKLTSSLDLDLARARCPSFERLRREFSSLRER